MYCPRSRLYRRLYDGYTLRCKYKGHTNRNTQVGVPPGWQGNARQGMVQPAIRQAQAGWPMPLPCLLPCPP